MKKTLLFLLLVVEFCAKATGQTIGTQTEPDYYASEANKLVLGTYAPNVAYDTGCHITSGDVDYYKVDVPAGGVLNLSIPVNATGIDFWMQVIDSVTNTVVWGSNSVSPLTEDVLVCGGAYYISIQSYFGSSTNPYALIVTYYPDATECNNTETEAYPIHPNDTVTAYLWGNNQTLGTYDNDDVDYYKVNIPNSGVLSVNIPVNATGIDFNVQVIDSATNATLYNSTSTSPLTEDVLVCGGTYYIYINSYDGNTSPNPYVLHVNFYPDATECNNTEAEAYQLHPNDTVTAYLWGNNNTLGTYDEADQDYYKVNIPNAGVLSVNMPVNATGITFNMEVIDSATNATLYNSTSTAPLTEDVLVCGGTYYIYINSYDGNTSPNPYVLHVNFYPDATECNNTEAEAYQLHPNDTVTAYLWGNNNTLGTYDEADQDYYKVSTGSCGLLTANIPANSTTIDFELEIIDSATGTTLRNNISSSGGAVTDTVSVTPGAYYIYVSSYDGNTSANPYILYEYITPYTAGTVTGSASLCAGAAITLTDGVTGGAWSASNGHATVAGGVVTGATVGTDTISYSVTNFCGAHVVATKIVTVDPLADAGTVTGTASVCAGDAITLTDGITGGTWSASNGNAIVAGGTVTGIITGTDIISYSVSNACGLVAATETVTINALPDAGIITGTDLLCISSPITFSDAVSGGEWSSSNISVAIVDGITGIVNGVSTGTATISYSVTNSCGTTTATEVVSVNLCTTGIKNLGNPSITTLAAYPNPNHGSFTLNISSPNKEGATIIITNMLGEKIKDLTATTNTDTQIQLDAPAGIYFISAITKSERIAEKIVVE